MEGPGNEQARLVSLRDLEILDTPAEERFDQITRLAAQIFDVPIALISLVDEDRQWFKSRVGLDVCETSREVSFCSHAILRREPMVVPNALHDERFARNPLVVDAPAIRFYAGVPLTHSNGHALGTLCIIDVRPRTLDGAQLELLRTLADIAEREVRTISAEQATQRLRESEDLYRSVIAAVEEGVIVRGEDGSIVACNASAERILGLPAKHILGRTSLDPPRRAVDAAGAPISDADHPAAVVLRTGKASSGVILGIDRPGAEVTWISVNAQPLIRDGESRPYAVVASFSDVTELRAVQQMKDEFVSVVSHELRTPLASIRGALHLITEGDLGELSARLRRMVEIAASNADRLSCLINDILDAERLKSGKTSIDVREVDTAALMGHVIDELQPLADRVPVTLHLTSCVKRALIDPDRIAQTLTNLIGNAIKFSPPGGSVHVSVMREGDDTVFRVVDEGRGISAGEVESIFERFHQVRLSDALEQGGTGLGLAICRGIVEQHGGRIWVESVVGEGSTFVFTVPQQARAGSELQYVAIAGARSPRG